MVQDLILVYPPLLICVSTYQSVRICLPTHRQVYLYTKLAVGDMIIFFCLINHTPTQTLFYSSTDAHSRTHERNNSFLPRKESAVLIWIQVKQDTVEKFIVEKASHVCPQHDHNFATYCLLFSRLLTSQRTVAYRQRTK